MTMMRMGRRRNLPVNVPNVLLFAVRISIRDICAAAEAANADAIAKVEKCILIQSTNLLTRIRNQVASVWSERRSDEVRREEKRSPDQQASEYTTKYVDNTQLPRSNQPAYKKRKAIVKERGIEGLYFLHFSPPHQLHHVSRMKS
tara:strand:- start:84 stop:518 length:435 start_codon:yes stop_codon:yes gene_type:complete